MKRAPIKPRSAKYATANRKAADARKAYGQQFPHCAICLMEAETKKAMGAPVKRPRLATEIHHMAGRNAKAPAKYEVPQNWLPLCDHCHRFVTDNSRFSAWLCFAAKRLIDPETADLAWLKKVKPTRFAHVST